MTALKIFRGRSVEDQMVATQNRSSGFDYLRMILSTSVIAWHSLEVCYGVPVILLAWASPLRPALVFLLPSFFCLSGFLVAGSLFRVGKISIFLTLRAMRIFPALLVEVFLSALLIGPLLTFVDLRTYFSSREFFSYFLNVVGDIHYILPGVFVHNPMPMVNAQLWTIPYELKCYIAIVVLALVGLLKRRRLLVLCVAAVIAVTYVHLAMKGTMPNHFGNPPGRMLVLSFLVGIVIYLYKDRIELSVGWFGLALAVFLVLLLFPQAIYLVPFPVGYMTVYLGLLNPKRIRWLFSGDYSYGLYLYGYPAQQVVSQLLPQFRFWYVNLVLSLALAGFVAFLSWTFVESRVLGKKRFIISSMEKSLSRMNNVGLAFFGKPKNASQGEL